MESKLNKMRRNEKCLCLNATELWWYECWMHMMMYLLVEKRSFVFVLTYFVNVSWNRLQYYAMQSNFFRWFFSVNFNGEEQTFHGSETTQKSYYYRSTKQIKNEIMEKSESKTFFHIVHCLISQHKNISFPIHKILLWICDFCIVGLFLDFTKRSTTKRTIEKRKYMEEDSP